MVGADEIMNEHEFNPQMTQMDADEEVNNMISNETGGVLNYRTSTSSREIDINIDWQGMDDYGRGGMRLKIVRDGGRTWIRRDVEKIKSMTRWKDDYEGETLRVLGVPFGGPVMGRDEHGEAFYEGTNIWMEIGDTVPVTYVHGYGPDDPMEWQENPVIIGRAKLVEIGEDGYWFEVQLDEGEALAQRILAGDEDQLRASSGAVGHLVRVDNAGLIDVWPVGELALMDVNEWRQPANDWAVVRKGYPQIAQMNADENINEHELGLNTVEAGIESGELKVTASCLEDASGDAGLSKLNVNNQKMEDFEMSDEVKEVQVEEQVPEVNVAAIADAVAGKMEGMVAQAVEKQVKAMLDEPATEEGAKMLKKNINVNKYAPVGDPDPVEDFYDWLRTGKGKIPEHTVQATFTRPDGTTFKAALQEGTTTEGGYLVPADELGRIIGKRDEMALMSRVGAQTFSTDRDAFNIPIEDTSMSRFTIVAEEESMTGAEDEPTFSRAGASAANGIVLYKFKKLIKISEELMEDYNSGLDGFLTDALGRAWAITDNYYMQVGTGSSMPQGVFSGGTAGLTLDSASAIGAKELPDLMGKLQMAYRPGAVWVMHRTTEAYLLGLTSTSQFQLHQAPVTSLAQGVTPLMGYPVYATEDCAAIGASAKSLLFGNFWYYGWVRNRSLRVKRLVELYAETGQIGIVAFFRAGGAVLQAEAFQYATHPTG